MSILEVRHDVTTYRLHTSGDRNHKNMHVLSQSWTEFSCISQLDISNLNQFINQQKYFFSPI